MCQRLTESSVAISWDLGFSEKAWQGFVFLKFMEHPSYIAVVNELNVR